MTALRACGQTGSRQEDYTAHPARVYLFLGSCKLSSFSFIVAFQDGIVFFSKRRGIYQTEHRVKPTSHHASLAGHSSHKAENVAVSSSASSHPPVTMSHSAVRSLTFLIPSPSALRH